MGREEFLARLTQGARPLTAGAAVGWSPRKVGKMMSDPDFRILIEEASEMATESIEETLHRVARGGNVSAIQMWLYNRAPDRWKDVKRIETTVSGHVDVNVIEGHRRAILDILRSPGGVLALAGGDEEIIDIEEIGAPDGGD